ENDLALNMDHIFEADECDAFDSDVDEIFWSIDENNKKKAETSAPKPISALTVYPPNTPVKLVPKILPTKIQVKINLYCSKGSDEKKESCVTSDSVKPKVLAPGMYAIDVKPIPNPLKNNRSAHLNYISHLKESVENRVNSSTEASGSTPRSNTKKIGSCLLRLRIRINHEMCVVNILNSVNVTPTVKIVLNKGKQIWKPKGKLSENSLNKTKQVWKATGKLFANVGYQWRSTGKKVALGKLNCGYQWRPTGKKFALGELCPLTKLSVQFSIITANRQYPNKFVHDID
ncbi:hypothetical protein Tco_1455494, partial [Tanacetum coccineum]